MLAALQRAGFVIKRSKGAHHYLVHTGNVSRRTTVSMHPGDLPERDVHDILKQARISRDEFLKLL
jgi:predicted RNA binding protein YcfA (HicA-like mRNA interferase family)